MPGALLVALLTLGQSARAQSPSVLLLPPETESRVAPVAKDDTVLHWNELLLAAVRADRTPPPLAARNMAMVHVAMYDAVNSVAPTNQHYLVHVRPMPGTSPEAAAASAAHRILVALYPRQKKTFDDALTASLSTLPAGESRECGVDLGRFVADRVLEWRKDDGADAASRHSARNGPGAWQPTSPGFKPAMLPEWGRLKPFAVRPGAKLAPEGPPAIGSEDYIASFREVRSLGSKDSTTRTAEQTEIALFWADDAGTSTPPGHWNRIAQYVSRARRLSLAENARLFALLNLAQADSAVLCWWCKFKHELWRPVTAIRASDDRGDTSSPADRAWTPLLNTPPFPAYTSGHSTFSASAASILANFFGTDRMRFETTSEGLPGVTRSFESFSAAAAEAGRSRIYGGIHWQFDNAAGLATGKALGDYVFRDYLTHLPRHEVARPDSSNHSHFLSPPFPGN